MKNCSRALRTSDWGRRFTFQQDTAHNQDKAGVASGHVSECPWSAQPEPDLKPIKHVWRYLKIAVQQCSPSSLTELKRMCREECQACSVVPKKTWGCNRQRCFNKVLSKGSEYLCKCDISGSQTHSHTNTHTDTFWLPDNMRRKCFWRNSNREKRKTTIYFTTLNLFCVFEWCRTLYH